MLVIGLGHKREVGKDLVGQLLKTELTIKFPQKQVVKTAFAMPLYQTAHKMFAWAGMQTKQYYDENKEEKEIVLPKIGKSPRQILIEIGLKFREVYADVWLDYAMNTQADILIITDLRFPNEAEKIKQAGGQTVIILRDVPMTDDPDDPDNQLNEHEWDIILSNLGTKKELNQVILDMINGLDRLLRSA